jgi:hypothetical protein
MQTLALQVTGTSLKLNKVDKPAQGEEGKKSCEETADAGAALAAGVDAALFLDEDVDLPSDEDD